MRILVINGPNINMLGIREKNIYGNNDYNSLVEKIKKEASELNCQVDFFQSNIEGEIITSIQKALGVYDGIIINPAAYTHYSIGILDALKSVNIPAIEVHISNIHQREDFRKKSVTAEGCIGQISGLGFEGYTLALRGLINLIRK
ncbi:MAG: type II 3-dehydroquinate dehydratase [Fusobacterium sp.]|uniref:type II 3-dehydroquinate dehydratase n=1 Tax=Fusobacterium sp. TaxID=68766 RepID=UPI002A757826|nr:type II 3-dehydroquinate dehydratase [Fusobacterium sp.]MDY2981648.1 type II 3-dehydroquinate dehydratase [Fusobacterium sp.]